MAAGAHSDKKRMAEIQVNLIPSDTMIVMALSRLRQPNQL